MMPCPKHTSLGCHSLLFHVEAQHNDQISTNTTIAHLGAKYNTNVKFKSGLCDYAPSTVEGYGKQKAGGSGHPGYAESSKLLHGEFLEIILGKTSNPTNDGHKGNCPTRPTSPMPTTPTPTTAISFRTYQSSFFLCAVFPNWTATRVGSE